MDKKELYMEQLRRLKADKIQENRKKLKRHGYNENDDTNMLAQPEDYNWQPRANHENGDYYGYTGWAENYASMLESFPVVVVPYSSMAGNSFGMLCNYRKTGRHPDFDYTQVDAICRKYNVGDGIGAMQHFCGDAQIGFDLGWGGILKKIEHYAELHKDESEETREFYEAERLMVKSIIAWIRRTSAKIEECWQQEEDPWRKQNLWEMLQTNRRVETEPPATLREACQFLCWYHLAGRTYNGDAAGFRLDRILLPYYEKDKAEGRIDDEDAIFYFAGLLLSDTKFHQLSGPNEDGSDGTNPVSWLILEAADRLDVSTNLTIAVHDGIDRDFFRHGVELVFRHRSGWPRFAGMDSLIRGFVRRGFDETTARRRVMGGCQWLTIPGEEYTMSDNVKLEMAKVFEIAFEEMMSGEEYSVEKLWMLYRKHMATALTGLKMAADIHLRTHKYFAPELFLNLFSHGTIEKGRDASDHSLRYYNIGIDAVGIAVAADSFAALEQRIEREHQLTWQQVADALKCNYAGEAQTIRECLQTAEKYGQAESLGCKWVERLVREFSEMVCDGTGEEGEIFLPGLFAWRAYTEFGKAVGATPDGRLAGTPLNQGANPMPGVLKNGEITTLSESILAAQCGYGNSAPFQLDIDPMVSEAEGGIDKLQALIAVHLKKGGTLVNVNVLDKEKILQANENPELFPDLVVRVTGYSAYFLSLSPELRQIVVDRVIQAM